MTATTQRMRLPRAVVAGIVSVAGVLAACGAPDTAACGASTAPEGEPRPSGRAPATTPRCDVTPDGWLATGSLPARSAAAAGDRSPEALLVSVVAPLWLSALACTHWLWPTSQGGSITSGARAISRRAAGAG
jgi:hypothetical protein